MKQKVVHLNVRAAPHDVLLLDKLIERGIVRSRTDGLNVALRSLIERYSQELKEAVPA